MTAKPEVPGQSSVRRGHLAIKPPFSMFGFTVEKNDWLYRIPKCEGVWLWATLCISIILSITIGASMYYFSPTNLLIPYHVAYCIPIALEELDLPYKVVAVSLEKREHKSDWFLKINPNGRLPALIDHSKEDFVIWESSAILLYIAQHFDPEYKISYDPVKEPKLYSEQLQWIFFVHGGISPIQGQAGHFLRLAPETIPYAIKRYQDEIKRLYAVLEERLEGREWLVDSRYSIVDIKAVTWIRVSTHACLDVNDYPNLKKWLGRITSRPKTYKGLGVPVRDDPEVVAKMTLEETRNLGATLFGFKKLDN